MDVILVPGLWLDASSWDAVVPPLEAAGHSAHPLTLPGLGGPARETSGIGVQDWIDAVIGEVDRLSPPDAETAGAVTLVGHSGGANIVWAAAEARADRISRVVMVDAVPRPDGAPINPGLPVVDGVVPFPGWDFFGEEAADIPAAARARWSARARSVPARVTGDPVVMRGSRRFSVPVALLMGMLDEDALRGEVARWDDPSAAEVEAIEDLRVVRLGTGHWPQFSQPEAFARTLVDAVE